MKINTPVTNNEQQFSETTEIISTTDLKGIVDSANEDFMAISGFEHDEIIGKIIILYDTQICRLKHFLIYGHI